MFTFLIIIHVIACTILVAVVLLQVGRGRGMLGFLGSGGAETLFGSRTGDVLTKSTTVVAIMFMITSLTLAYLSLQKSGSIARSIKSVPGVASQDGAIGRGAASDADHEFMQKGAEAVTKAKEKVLNLIPDLGIGEETQEAIEAEIVTEKEVPAPSETTKNKIRYDDNGNKIVDEMKYDASGKLISHKEITYDKLDQVISEKELPLQD